MPQCSKCARPVPDGSRFCPACGAPIVGETLRTQTSLPTEGPGTPSSYPSLDDARFLPGNVVAGRYRVVGLLGRGGMGEVYRADDLKLGQPVALKFLPEAVDRDPERLRRFLNEVRLALRITHPNVCRVHDIGEVDGQHFISMEYVDGEDLASLLRRIGRLPQERAVEIARQLCAGLAAAHDQGILHRDLKPANVMIDGRGRARITDFGLAGLSGTFEGADLRAGTPAYMAPEQLAGREVTTRSDIYALGLVLYEMFSGKPAFSAGSATEMLQLQQSTTPGDMSSIPDMDPAVEQAILRALSAESARRPASALALAAALPGGDPLAAALAAGETPSPEMVADAGDHEGMAPGAMVLALLAIVIGLGLLGWLSPRRDAMGEIETPLSIGALNERARLTLERLGYDEAGGSRAHGVIADADYVRWLQDDPPRMRERARSGKAPVYLVWHRCSPEPLLPLDRMTRGTDFTDPPMTLPGMLRLAVDPHGRLVRLTAVPPDRDLPPDEAAPERDAEAIWSDLFREAGLDPAHFDRVEPVWTPDHFADERAAWQEAAADPADAALRVEAAAFRGRPVWFRIVGPWSRTRDEAREDGASGVAQDALGVAVALSVLISLVFLGRRNVRLGRSDLKGARRVGLFVFVVQSLSALVAATYFADPSQMLMRSMMKIGLCMFLGAVGFTAYVALEPYVRRLWPRVLISWTRLLSGRLRDPLVGRDLLLGGALGVATRLLDVGHTLIPPLVGLPEEPLGISIGTFLFDPRMALGALFNIAGGSVAVPMLTLVILVVLRLLLRRTGVAIGALLVVSVGLGVIGSPHPLLDLGLRAAVMGLTLFTLMRLGLMAAMSMWLFDWGGELIRTLDPSAWTAPSMVVSVVVLLAVAGYASFTALGKRALFEDEALAQATP